MFVRIKFARAYTHNTHTHTCLWVRTYACTREYLCVPVQIYPLWNSSPRPMAHKTIAPTTDLRRHARRRICIVLSFRVSHRWALHIWLHTHTFVYIFIMFHSVLEARMLCFCACWHHGRRARDIDMCTHVYAWFAACERTNEYAYTRKSACVYTRANVDTHREM